MKIIPIVLSIILAGCASSSKDYVPEPDSDWNGGFHYNRAKELRMAADNGDSEAMFDLMLYLMRHAPDPKFNYVNSCNGVHVSDWARKRLEAKGQDCKVVEDSENKALVRNWSSVGTKADAMKWLHKAAKAGNIDAMAIRDSMCESSPSICSE